MKEVIASIAPVVLVGGVAFLIISSKRAELCKKYGVMCTDEELTYEAIIEKENKYPDEPFKPEDPKAKCYKEREGFRKSKKGTRIPGYLGGIGNFCNKTSDCSASGLISDRTQANIFSDVSCDEGRCQFKGKDWMGDMMPRSKCRKTFLSGTGTCDHPANEENINRENNSMEIKYITCDI